MLGWWAAFFFAGTIVSLSTSCVFWGYAAALAPLLVHRAGSGPGAAGTVRLLRRAALTAATGLVVFQHAVPVPAVSTTGGGAFLVHGGAVTGCRPIDAVRGYTRSVLSSRHLSGTSRKMLPALLLAERSALDRSMRDLWRDLGIAHFLALSGLHLGIVAVPVYRALVLLRLRGILLESAAFLALSFYAAAAGAPPSLLRAASLLFVVRMHRLCGRRIFRDEALLTGAFIVCLAVPRSVSDPGFMLSVCAAGGVLLVGLPLGRMVLHGGRGRPVRAAGWFASALCVSCSAMVYTIPLTTRLFGRAPLSGPILSVLLAPLVTALLYAGFAYVAAGHLLGAAGAAPVNLLASVTAAVPALYPSRWSAAVVRGDMNEGVFAAGAALLACALARGAPRRAAAAAGAGIIMSSFFLGLGMPAREAGHGCDTIAAGALMNTRTGILLITGPFDGPRAARLSRILSTRGCGTIECVIATHGGCSTVEGLLTLDERVRLRRIVVSPWLRLCPAAIGLPSFERLEPLNGEMRIDLGGRRIVVSGPRSPPGSARIVSRDDSGLRISPLDSDR